ncbi:hypothetical protein MLD38_037538 [Melastoma candidum]|uniref:Uncharacterized protein n=1 Tax=Melastoma candidum TaxID=119954 RepID=A0ACB9LNC6_9MYRT|nr:hypothetical protein MLD38_037538 [Melastoma candidum]
MKSCTHIENEYGNIEGSYGSDGKDYLSWYKNWGSQDPHRTAEDIAFAVARFFQLGGSFHNYYMYHGGTNFNKTAGGPFIATTFDYDAPLNEYGNPNQPKWGHLKRLHEIIMSMEEILTYGEKRDITYGYLLGATIYSYEGKQSCFLANANYCSDFVVDLLGTKFTGPAWSVAILPDCYTEVYNTAKVSCQTSIMVNEPNKGEDQYEPYVLEWQWRPEHFEVLMDGTVDGSAFTVN